MKTLSVISKAFEPESRIMPIAPPTGVASAQIVSDEIIEEMAKLLNCHNKMAVLIYGIKR